MSDRRALMGAVSGGASGGIKVSTYTFNGNDGSGGADVAVNESASKILFCHFYDTDAVYETAGTTYEGFHLGPAAAHFSDVGIASQWCCWRTSANGSQTGYNTYGNINPFANEGRIRVTANPYLKSAHTYVLEVYYTD